MTRILKLLFLGGGPVGVRSLDAPSLPYQMADNDRMHRSTASKSRSMESRRSVPGDA